MIPDKKELYQGVKTFFIAPDLTLMPEDFLSHFFLKGFEAYYLMDDQYLDMETKIRVLFRLFPDFLLFFNIDRKLGKIEWPKAMAGIKDDFGERAKMGVLYSGYIEESTRKSIEKTYLYDIGTYCGCIPLMYKKQKNLALLQSVLVANEANGRRKSLRAICGSTCTFNLVIRGIKYLGEIRDISVSHFSCAFDGPDPDLPMYEKARGFQLNLSGIICTVDGVVFTKRVIEGSMLYVFVFRSSRDREGLDAEMLAKVNGFIHSHFEKGVLKIANKAFEGGGSVKREGAPADSVGAIALRQ
jgi:hypothetical protein